MQSQLRTRNLGRLAWEWRFSERAQHGLEVVGCWSLRDTGGTNGGESLRCMAEIEAIRVTVRLSPSAAGPEWVSAQCLTKHITRSLPLFSESNTMIYQTSFQPSNKRGAVVGLFHDLEPQQNSRSTYEYFRYSIFQMQFLYGSKGLVLVFNVCCMHGACMVLVWCMHGAYLMMTIPNQCDSQLIWCFTSSDFLN